MLTKAPLAPPLEPTTPTSILPPFGQRSLSSNLFAPALTFTPNPVSRGLVLSEAWPSPQLGPTQAADLKTPLSLTDPAGWPRARFLSPILSKSVRRLAPTRHGARPLASNAQSPSTSPASRPQSKLRHGAFSLLFSFPPHRPTLTSFKGEVFECRLLRFPALAYPEHR